MSDAPIRLVIAHDHPVVLTALETVLGLERDFAIAAATVELLRRRASEREAARILTPREIEIVRLIVDGLRTPAIAARLNVAESTVKTHLHNAYDKLGLRGRAALIAYARKSSWQVPTP